MTRLLSLAFCACFCACLGLATIARAQTPTDEEAIARERFEHGRALIEEGRFAEARVELEAALSLAPRPPIAFNLAVALRGMGELVAAAEVCDALLSGQHGALDDPVRLSEAEALCAEIDATVAEVTVVHDGPAPAELRLDGLSLGMLGAGEARTLPVDPGEHALSLLGEGAPIDRALVVEPGERLRIELSLPHPASGVDVPLVLGLSVAGAALVAVIVVVAVVATGSPGAPPGDLPITETLLGPPLATF